MIIGLWLRTTRRYRIAFVSLTLGILARFQISPCLMVLWSLVVCEVNVQFLVVKGTDFKELVTSVDIHDLVSKIMLPCIWPLTGHQKEDHQDRHRLVKATQHHWQRLGNSWGFYGVWEGSGKFHGSWELSQSKISCWVCGLKAVDFPSTSWPVDQLLLSFEGYLVAQSGKQLQVLDHVGQSSRTLGLVCRTRTTPGTNLKCTMNIF